MSLTLCYLLLYAAAAIIIVSVIIYEHRKNRQYFLQHVLGAFGTKPPDIKYNFDELRLYWDSIAEGIPAAEKIDEVTWNDLEMDLLFKRICRCSSFAGEQVLYASLHHPASPEDILGFDKLAGYFQSHQEPREKVQAVFYRLGCEEAGFCIPSFITNLDNLDLPHKSIYRLLQVLLAALLLASAATWSQTLALSALAVFVVNAAVYTIQKQKIEIYLDTLGSIIRLVRAAKKLSSMNLQSGTEPLYKLPEHISKNQALFDRLARRTARLQKRKQAAVSGDIAGILQDYVIGATFWDFTCYTQVIKLLKGHESEFMELLKYAGTIDMAVSVASFRESLPLYCVPGSVTEPVIHAEGLYHPLLDSPVCNDITLSRTCIITGSNASGKSTFIKAAAINAILAQTISTCTAAFFALPPSQVITSMAVRDDLISGESYYIREIRYLGRIIKSLDTGRLIFCIIDEILRGTNTSERIAASAAILKFLSRPGCLPLVASHDRELADILGDRCQCSYFGEQVKDSDVCFDYKIHDGICSTFNAVRLLEFTGFPKEIIREARCLLMHSPRS